MMIARLYELHAFSSVLPLSGAWATVPSWLPPQIEEEGNDNDIISKLELAGSKGNGLFMIDKELSTRVYNPPVKEKN